MLPGLTSVNLSKKAAGIPNSYPTFEFNKWVEEIDIWLNENCKSNTYFANRFMRFNFQNPSDALAFKLVWSS